MDYAPSSQEMPLKRAQHPQFPSSDPRVTFPGYLPLDGPIAASNLLVAPPRLTPYVPLSNSLRAGGYIDELAASGVRLTPGIVGRPAPADIGGVGTVEDPSIKREPSPGAGNESNVLFVDNLPTDCTRREVGHLFRPFIGFKDIKLVHKEARQSGDKARVLCFVEFTDIKCALTALDALQDYRFDDKKPQASLLRIQFAHFPFSLPS